jgi:hypothetical protein
MAGKICASSISPSRDQVASPERRRGEGIVPEFVTRTGHPTGVVYVADLGLVIPLMLMAGWWLRTRQP